MIHVHPVDCSTSSVVESISCTKRTTAAEVVAKVTRKLGIENGLSYVLVEMHKDRGEEMILAQSDLPVQRMLLWPTQFQHSYKFVLRETDESGNSDCPDLCAISSLSQNKILEILRKRFLKDKIYTYSADTLISINPYKFMPIYNPKYMTLYQNRRKEDLEPHIYAIADTAFNTMVQTKQNQCIVITGKSGSGKTQATHFLVHHSLALCQKSYMTGVENMLTGAGPVLEAFGNAQTEHNNNSSRFGKFLKIHFYGSGLLSGADVQTYLLEKSRLVHQEPNEKNFHIFYYLLYGTSPEELKEIYLDQNTNYNYLKQCSKHANTDAPAELERLRQAMEVMGFYIGAQRSIFRLIAAIILLGNITFKMKSGRDETLEIQDESYLTSVSLLLGLDKNVVRKCLLTRKAKAGAGERFVLSLKLEEARATRDAMSKALYQSLFDWAVSSVNMALAQKTRDTKLKSQSQWIGLLDIFGFEDFVKNSFEQFCINYASEHLQHYCIKHTFQLEQEEYRAEGLTWKEVDYADNSGCLLLYEKKITGLFHLIDENFPGANNHTLLSQFNRVHGNTRYYDTTVVKEDAFMIVHYAGKVKYQIKDFREKNHDQVREDLITLVRTSQSSFIQGIVSKSPAAVVRWGVLRAIVRAMFAFKNAGKKTLLSTEEERSTQHPEEGRRPTASLSSIRYILNIYSNIKLCVFGYSANSKRRCGHNNKPTASLSLLMSTLEQAHPFFVRCIQPNSKKSFLQLLLPQSNATLPEIKNFLLKIRLQPGTDFQIGKTQIFLRDHASRVLKESLHRVVLKHVILLQSRIRGYLARRSYCQQRAAAVQIQSYWRMVETQREIVEWHLAASIIQDAWRCYLGRKFEELMVRFQARLRGFLLRRSVDIIRQSWPIYSSASKKEQTIDDKSDETSPCMSPPNRTPQFNDTNNNHDISDKLKGTIDSPEPQATPPVDKTPFRARTKAGELFLKAAYPPNKIVVVKPVVYVPSSKRKQYDDETDYAKSYSLKPSVKTQDTGNFMYTTSPSKIDTEMEAAAPVQDKQAEKNTSDLKPTDHPLNGEIAETNYLTRAHSESSLGAATSDKPRKTNLIDSANIDKAKMEKNYLVHNSQTSSFNGEHLVDQVFKISLNEFCANLTALYSFATLSGDTNGLRYKDIVSNFRQVLEKTANHYSLDQYAAMMGVNGFRGYMNEFMNDVLPKYTAREAKSKRKKGKDDSEKLGHHFTGVQWGITQVCEFCNNVMWLMEAGLMCKICKFACHKKCFKQLTTRCPGSTEVDKLKSKPKKLFGESLASLASKESSVPTFIDKCISYMEMNGIYQEGIYRKSAAVAQNKLLEESLNKDIECQKVNFDDYNIHCVASCFKKFLRSLPSPLVPYDKYFEFLQAARITKEREKVNALYHVLEGIPRQNHATLERIVFHLARVAQQEPTNRMSPSNLAIVFTPCFFAAPPHVSPIEAAEQVGDMTKAVECVISEQVKKIRSTLESISEIQSAESSTNERLKQIRQSI
uniref:Myosin motor domain-containing protein n=1 Tax=Ciona savignyi TaxID=51511 RepID=H2YUM3_CIOSA